MKAIVRYRYGPPDALQLKEVEKPSPLENEVLVKVHATSVNAADLDLLKGIFLVRFSGPLRPKNKILGSDMAGQIEAVGVNVKQFKPGDRVFADLSVCGYGAFAEYVCVPEDILTLKPSSITLEQAATLPQAAILAVQGLCNKEQIQPGQKVLVNGAGGGVGTFAIQIAKYFGAEVTGVDSREKLEMMHSIGADHVIDYGQEDFSKNGQQYDLILDTVVSRSVSDYDIALSPGGICIMVGGSMPSVLSALIKRSWLSKRNKSIDLLAWKPNRKEDLSFLTELLKIGCITPVIDKIYQLSDVAKALKYLEEGHAKGKVVITIVGKSHK